MSSQAILTQVANVKETQTGAFRTMDNDHAYIHQGKLFTAYHKATITAGGTLAFSFKTPTVAQGKVVHYRLAGIFPSGATR